MRKLYSSPEAEFLKIEFLKDVLLVSNPDVGPDVDVRPGGDGEVPKESVDIGDGDDIW